MVRRFFIFKIILLSLCGDLFVSSLSLASAATPEKIIWTDHEKVVIKKAINAFRDLVISLDEDVYVFQKGLSSGKASPPSTSLSGFGDAPFLVNRIPKGTRIIDLSDFDPPIERITAELGCSFTHFPYYSEGYSGGIIEASGRCRVILLKVLKELNASAIRSGIEDDVKRISRECHMDTEFYSLLDQTLEHEGVLVKPEDITPKGQNFIENLKMLDSFRDSRYSLNLTGAHEIGVIKWAKENHLVKCVEKKEIDVFKETPNLVKEVIASTFVLPKDTFGFHWQNQEAILWDKKMPKDASDYQVQEYIRYSTSRFWSDPNSGGSGGTGLYFATDPVASADVGATLLKVALRKGTRYFSYRTYGSYPKFSEVVTKELEGQGCNAQNLGNIYYNDDATCENVARALTKELKISFVVYTYGGSLPATCGQHNTQQAFVVFDPSAIVPEKTFIFPGKGVIDTPNSSKKRELGMLSRFHIDNPLTNSKLSNLYAELTTSDGDFDAWVHEGFYGCDYDPFTIHEIK